MKKGKLFLMINLLLVCLSLSGCRRNTNDVWEDSKTAGRHVNRGFRALLGKNTNSRQVRSPDQFMPSGRCYTSNQPDEFIPLADEMYCDEVAMADSRIRQPKESPGDFGSSVPGIDSFRDPSTVQGLSSTFKNIYFEYNSNLVKGSESLAIVHQVADYMKKNPYTYIFIEGHCDEKGPEAYNLALGSRRSNAVRNLLISEGVNPDNIFTISYGKERPLVLDSHEEAWSKNRRAEFKVYQR
jgi:peptidoglycan-associated lipoprotein